MLQDCYINAFIDNVYVLSLSPRFTAGSVRAWTFATNTFTANSCLPNLWVALGCFGGQQGYLSIDNMRVALQAMPSRSTSIPVCSSTIAVPTTTTTTRTTSSAISLSPSQTAGFGGCPAGDGKYYTATDGRIYRMHCNLDYFGNDMINAVVTSNLQTCADYCARISGCNAGKVCLIMERKMLLTAPSCFCPESSYGQLLYQARPTQSASSDL